MRKNIQAFQLTRVKLPSRTLASKAPTKPNKTTFSIISMSVFNNIRCQAERCQPSWVRTCQSIWMVIGWWIELLSKQIPRQRAERPNSREHYPAISAALQNAWVRGRRQPWAAPAGSTLTPTSANLMFLGPVQVCCLAGLCPDVCGEVNQGLQQEQRVHLLAGDECCEQDIRRQHPQSPTSCCRVVVQSRSCHYKNKQATSSAGTEPQKLSILLQAVSSLALVALKIMIEKMPRV